MRIEINGLSYGDYIKCRIGIDKTSLSASLLILYFLIMQQIRHMSFSLITKIAFAMLGAIAGSIIIYGILYFFKYRKAKKESPIIKAEFGKDGIRNFNIYGKIKEYKYLKYKDCNRIYHERWAFYFRFQSSNVFYVPFNHLNKEEKDFIFDAVNDFKMK